MNKKNLFVGLALISISYIQAGNNKNNIDIFDKIAQYIHDNNLNVVSWDNAKIVNLIKDEADSNLIEALKNEFTETKKEELLEAFNKIYEIQNKIKRQENLSISDKADLKEQKDRIQGLLLIRKKNF